MPKKLKTEFSTVWDLLCFIPAIYQNPLLNLWAPAAEANGVKTTKKKEEKVNKISDNEFLKGLTDEEKHIITKLSARDKQDKQNFKKVLKST